MNFDAEYVLQTATKSDITLIVENKPIEAHKHILSQSQILDVIIRNDPDSKEITIMDEEYEIFQEMLMYMYTIRDPTEIKICEKLLCMADKYTLPQLMITCSDILINNISALSVCKYLLIANKCECAGLKLACLEFIDTNITQILLTSEDFYKLDCVALDMILDRSTLKIAEIELFNGLFRWCNYMISNSDLTKCDCHSNFRQHVLGNLIYKIRYPLMTSVDFSNGPVEYKILQDKDVVNIYKYIVTKIPSSALLSKFCIEARA